MLQLIRMAWRNLGRHPGRTRLSLLAVAMGVLVVILFKGFVDGMLDTMLDQNINLNSGHLRIIRPEYRAKERLLSLAYPVGESGKTYSGLVGDIRKLPEVTEATGRIRFGMILATGEEQETVLGIGADLAAENRISHLDRFLTDRGAGRLPRPGKQEIMLGVDLLKKLRLEVGDKVNAVFSTSLGSFKAATFTIVGKMASGLKMLDEGTVYLPLDQAMSLLELEDMVTEIVVFGPNANRTGNLQRELRNRLAAGAEKLMVIPWNQYNQLIVTMEQARGVYNGFYVFMLMLASFVVFNTLTMVVAERSKEIGMLAALGMTAREIQTLFIVEGLSIAVLGSAAGTILGGLCNWILSRTGIDISQTLKIMPPELTFAPKLYPSYRGSVLLFSFGLGVVVTMLAAYLPARRAAALKPTEALRTI
ncbi:putative ABC transport system permease protein [Hydrogenispora ethanolica]|uniref:Putative ABC transport system permease protein n=1 Tax=Hydrogenispora ethanolica TaxID=1082276 RepID=A0A4R1SAL1_HYDET|nr:FtsX-like permease family protein [Hydrogenispora ethanolica]TCL76399.1 putative ABC transport system permease protein [Hydrogenispora ethanolica]